MATGKPLSTTDFTATTLAENLALDEALLHAVEAGESPEFLRFWEWPTLAVVLGANGVQAEEVHEATCLSDSVPIMRRSSGGGTVLIGSGCLMYSLVLRYERAAELTQVGGSYQWILERLAKALPLVASVCGTSDLSAAERKFSGNAQQRKSQSLLHHGTLLYAFDLTSVGRYLPLPPRRPAYRGMRTHGEFLMNLPTTRATLCDAITQAFNGVAAALPTTVLAEMQTRALQRYSTREWLERR